jgi:hypothetical protein
MLILCIYGVQTSLTVLRGPILDEVHQQLNPWVSQVNYSSLNRETVFSLLILASLSFSVASPGSWPLKF